MEKYGDLHIHTLYSDGTDTPENIFIKAKKANLQIISITDHDTINAYEENDLTKLSEKYNIEIIKGIEFSADCNFGKNSPDEVHILGLGIDTNCRELKSYCDFYQQMREKRAKKMIKKLQQMNIKISWDDLKQSVSKNIYGRLHIAKTLVRKKYASSIKEAFEKFIGYDSPSYVKKEQKNIPQICELITKCKGIPIIAHPGLQHIENKLKELKELGIKGVEVFHPEHDPITAKNILQSAQKLNLLITGGSDYHGLSKDNIKLGDIKLPYKYIIPLKEAIDALR